MAHQAILRIPFRYVIGLAFVAYLTLFFGMSPVKQHCQACDCGDLKDLLIVRHNQSQRTEGCGVGVVSGSIPQDRIAS